MSEEKILVGKNDALIIIDMQNDFANRDGALYVAGLDSEPSVGQLIASAAKLFDLPFREKCFSRDWHKPDSIEFKTFGRHCVQGTVGADIVDGLSGRAANSSMSIFKGDISSLYSYSVSTCGCWFEIVSDFRTAGIDRVFLCGLAYTHCVGESAIDFARQGFKTYVIRDATRSVLPPYGDPGLMTKKLELYGVDLVTVGMIS